MAEKQKKKKHPIVPPSAQGPQIIMGVAKKLKEVTPKPPKKKTPTW